MTKIFLLVVLLALLLCIESKKEKVLCMDFSFGKSLFSINSVGVGTPPQAIPLKINQNTAYTTFNISDYDPSKSETSKKLGDIETEGHFTLPAYQDSLAFSSNNVVIPEFKVALLSEESKKELSPGIGLGLDVKDESYSLIHALKKNNVIDRLSYTFKKSSYLYGNVCFGSSGNKKHPYSSRSASCSVGKSTFWGCKMQRAVASLTGEIYEYGKFVSFQQNRKKMVFPCDFMDFLEKKVFADFFKDGRCEATFKDNKKYFECDKFSTSTKMQKVNFEFEGFLFQLTNFELMPCYQGSHCFSRYKCYLDSPEQGFIIGYELLREFVATFDYEERRVTFSSSMIRGILQSIYKKGGRRSSSIQVGIMKSFLVIMILSIIVLLFTKGKTF